MTVYNNVERSDILYLNPKTFFVRELLLFVTGFIVLVIGVIFTGMGGSAIVIAIIINIITLIAMLVMTILSFIYLIRRIADNTNQQVLGFYVLNVLFSVFVVSIFIVFYLVLFIAGSIIVLPFIQ